METFFLNIVTILNTIPLNIYWLISVFFIYGLILLIMYFFDWMGLMIYSVLAIIIANIQVLKIVHFSFFPDPVALGTLLFASVYLVNIILTEYYGKQYAYKNIFFGFTFFFIWTILMLWSMGFPYTNHSLPIQKALQILFLPDAQLFIAGMASYLISQTYDVLLFGWIKKRTNAKFLWFRNILSTSVSALLDNTIFSLLAWIILATHPLPLKVVIMTYILGTYGLRLFLVFFDTPFVYLAKIAKCPAKRSHDFPIYHYKNQ